GPHAHAQPLPLCRGPLLSRGQRLIVRGAGSCGHIALHVTVPSPRRCTLAVICFQARRGASGRTALRRWLHFVDWSGRLCDREICPESLDSHHGDEALIQKHAICFDDLLLQSDCPCVLEQQDGGRTIDRDARRRREQILVGKQAKEVYSNRTECLGLRSDEVRHLARCDVPYLVLLKKKQIHDADNALVAQGGQLRQDLAGEPVAFKANHQILERTHAHVAPPTMRWTH